MAEKKPKANLSERQETESASQANGVYREDGIMTKRRRTHNYRPEAKQVPPSFDWRLLMNGNQLGLLSLIVSCAVALYSAGWIPGIAKQTDVSGLAAQIVEIKGAVTDLGKEFRDTRLEIIKATTSIARIEGRMDATPKPRVVRQPVPVPAQRQRPASMIE